MFNSKVHIVTVVNDFYVYNETIKDNQYMKDCELIVRDNTQEDISIAQRYNDFLENHLHEISPHDWLVFCDQGFCFLEDFKDVLKTLAPNAVYGIMGARAKRKFSWRKFKFVNEIVKIGGVTQDLESHVPHKRRKAGKVSQVDTLDGCCLIVNAELLQDFHLGFSEKLPFYFFVEEFCLAAYYKYKIKSYVLPLDAYYVAPTEFPPEYYESRDYLKAEYQLKDFASYATVDMHPTRYSLDNMVETVIETVTSVTRH